jgi:hypothetical protein
MVLREVRLFFGPWEEVKEDVDDEDEFEDHDDEES